MGRLCKSLCRADKHIRDSQNLNNQQRGISSVQHGGYLSTDSGIVIKYNKKVFAPTPNDGPGDVSRWTMLKARHHSPPLPFKWNRWGHIQRIYEICILYDICISYDVCILYSFLLIISIFVWLTASNCSQSSLLKYFFVFSFFYYTNWAVNNRQIYVTIYNINKHKQIDGITWNERLLRVIFNEVNTKEWSVLPDVKKVYRRLLPIWSFLVKLDDRRLHFNWSRALDKNDLIMIQSSLTLSRILQWKLDIKTKVFSVLKQYFLIISLYNMYYLNSL